MVAGHGLSAPGRGKVQQVFPRPATDDTIAGQVMLSHRPYFVTDIQHDDAVPPLSRQMIEALGTRSQVTVPMLRAGEAIGAITVGWRRSWRLWRSTGQPAANLRRPGRDRDRERAAVQRDQGGAERQTATADILKVIACSPSDVQPVFDAIAASANRLIGGFSSSGLPLHRWCRSPDGFTPTNPAADEALQATFPRPGLRISRRFKLAQAGESRPDSPTPKPMPDAGCWTSRGRAAFAACCPRR